MKLFKLSKISLVVLASFAAGSASAMDLMEAYRAAQSEDAAFASAKATQLVGQEKKSQGQSLLMPTVNLTANVTYNDTSSKFANYKSDSSGFGVNLRQPLFQQQAWIAFTESEIQVAISEAQFEFAKNDLMLRVAQGYFEVLVAQDNVQLTDAQKKAISEQLEQAKRNFEVGTSTITDTYEAQARYDLINAQEISAQSNLEVKRRALQQMTNKDPGLLNSLNKEIALEVPHPADIEKWVADAQQQNIQITIATAAAELAEKEVTRNLGGHMPTLDFVASYNKNTNNPTYFGATNFGSTDTTVSSFGLQFNMPLFQGGATQSRYREAEANRDKAKQDLENARRTVGVQARQAYLGVVSGISQVKALQQALKSSESLLEASKLGQGVGVRTNIDVLNAQQQLFSTRRDLYQAQYNYLLSRLRLKAAVGTLSDDDIGGVNQALRP
ncbi:MAG: TolC family outer membrane protein [Gallionellaceae bacterium]|jgi:outer membrane protein